MLEHINHARKQPCKRNVHGHSPFQATFTRASALDLGQGLGALVADLGFSEVDLVQRGVRLQSLRCNAIVQNV